MYLRKDLRYSTTDNHHHFHVVTSLPVPKLSSLTIIYVRTLLI